MDTVGFNSVRLDAELEDVKTILDTAVEYEGEGVLSQYEEKFAKSCLTGLTRQGNSWDYSDARKDVVVRIEKKLDKEGLLT